VKEIHFSFDKNNFVRTQSLFLLKFKEQIMNNSSLGRRIKSPIFKLRANICYYYLYFRMIVCTSVWFRCCL